MRKLNGLVIATVTPMHNDGTVDTASFVRHLNDVLEGGAEGVFVVGTTGEGLLLEDDERVALARTAVEVAAGRIAVVGHCGALTTARAAELAVRMRDAGVDGVATLTPFFYHVDADAMVEHFRLVADAARCPTYLYGIPGLTGVAIPAEVVRRVVGHPHFGGLKYSACDLPQIVAYAETGARVFIGCDALITAAMRAGAAGTVSGTGACLPGPYAHLFARIRKGADPAAAQAAVTRFDALLAAFPPIAGYKAVLKRRGIIASAAVRRPLRPLTPAETERLHVALTEMAL